MTLCDLEEKCKGKVLKSITDCHIVLYQRYQPGTTGNVHRGL